MQLESSGRGFKRGNFVDSRGNKCSLQESSSADEPAIWLGTESPKLVVFKDAQKGAYIETEMPANFSVNSRMHLTISQVKELIPHLIKFVQTGEL
jgi:hypothetical protein